MMRKSVLLIAFIITTTNLSVAQILPFTIPNLHVPPDGNGIGNMSASVPSNNAEATIANPAQLGIFSLDGLLNAGTNVKERLWEQTEDFKLESEAINVGITSSRFVDAPYTFSVGLGYSRTVLDLGQFYFTPDLPPFEWKEQQDNYTVAAGFDWIVKFGFGYNFKNLAQPSVDSMGVNMEGLKVNGHDYGVMLEIPVVDIASRFCDSPITFTRKLNPIVNINIGYSRSNISDNPTALLRKATLGLNVEFALGTIAKDKEWRLLSFIWAREAEGILLYSVPVPTTGPVTSYVYGYKSGLGDIAPIDNLIFGRSNGNVNLRKGWQVGVADFVYVRGGTDNEIGNPFKTFGESFRLYGMLKLLNACGMIDTRQGAVAYIVEHLDLEYHFCRYTNYMNSDIAGPSFEELNIAVK